MCFLKSIAFDPIYVIIVFVIHSARHAYEQNEQFRSLGLCNPTNIKIVLKTPLKFSPIGDIIY